MAGRVPFRWFSILLPVALLGYLFGDRSFAYLHIPSTPLFVGELVLIVGLVESFRGRRIIAAQIRRSVVLRLLLAFMLVGLVRLIVVDAAEYGLLALRDSALWYYALFAPLVVLLVLVRPEWLGQVRATYVRIMPLFLLWAPFAVILERVKPLGWTVPDSTLSVTSFRPGNVGVHVALMLAYLWLVDTDTSAAAQRRRAILTALGLAGVLVVGTQNRAGLVAATLGLGIAWLVTPLRTHLTMTAGAAILVAVAIPAALGVSFEVGGREVSVAQIAENTSSIVLGDRASGNLGDTVEWRQQLWSLAVDDLFDSGQQVTGFGFGPNIAARYSFSNPDKELTLRNPHNSHLSILMRMGLAGATVWILLWLAWATPLVQALRRVGVRRGGDTMRLWTWSGIGVVSILVNAFFDPTLEGPQVAVWLWTLVGIGVVAHLTMRYENGHPDTASPATATASSPTGVA